ncbi:uncharacterized protein M421DRAFT_177849 [Didymella exigua CBS 183.55]|uniref:Protein kinase domain-containing protein n=1 Tax=Didymella exigua CBS 183.55 TaxID=1150837 RepID=A0A6A5RIR8_9PLEO|nr:uncharacterized protein M421DRAFT_177849 [Didymella exigua CBS 183.55]KAF1927363.1 hypothetical protein M421DRAFT_177849 [Didymella exigua CBS 183.55]
MTVKIIGDDDKARLKNAIDAETGPHKRLSRLKCPNIVQFYGSSFRDRGVTPHLGFIDMEYAPFGDLHGTVRKLHSGQK